ncbi:SAF domain-containing protein [Arthrobacter koreensis]|uniref:SAF domain-containing protein n=1 Tax=Arthrobacter koreensis TaxID=199136 RepID=UPI002DB9E78A|nr:SAF domain-containing protein [Arthrobacter koreensis]MEB7503552.1 SAF domain-containing protein [Arthrobacter koreensis]
MFSTFRRGRLIRQRDNVQPAGARPAPAPPGRVSPGRGRLHRVLVRRRRFLAGVLVAAAAGITVQAMLPAEPAAVAAAAAARDLPAGHIITPGDLRMVRLPPKAVPPGALTGTGSAAGEQLAVPLRSGTVLSETLLVGDGLLAGSPEGTAALPLRPADPASARLLAPGVLIDVVAAADEGFDGAGPPVVLASGVPVLWVTGAGSGAGSWPGADAAAEEQLVVVAARAADAPELAVASASGGLYLIPSAR